MKGITTVTVLILLSLLLLLLSSLSLSSGEDNLFHLYTIPNAIQRNAVCNDGSPYGFYFRKGNTTNWVFRLQGGGWCWDEASCSDRWRTSKYWMTSKGLPQTMTDGQCIGPACHAGILTSNPTLNPYFFDANHVYIWYCTSDSHVGNRSASSSIGGWSFYGKSVIKAIMEEITSSSSNNNFGFNTALNVLITGDSAGGVATLNNIDWMVSYLKPFTSSKTNFKGFIDAGWFLDIPTFEHRMTSFQNISKALIKNAGVIYNSKCEEFYQSIGETWRCFHAQYVHKFIAAELFYNEFGYDSANIFFDGLGNPPYSGASQQFVDNFHNELMSTQAHIQNLFQASCFAHETEDTFLFYAVTVQRIRLAVAVGEWVFQGKSRRLLDTCSDINCNPSC